MNRFVEIYGSMSKKNRMKTNVICVFQKVAAKNGNTLSQPEGEFPKTQLLRSTKSSLRSTGPLLNYLLASKLSPYNNNCPMGRRFSMCIVGCVATALSLKLCDTMNGLPYGNGSYSYDVGW